MADRIMRPADVVPTLMCADAALILFLTLSISTDPVDLTDCHTDLLEALEAKSASPTTGPGPSPRATAPAACASRSASAPA